jgi:hypothetical protein
LARQLLAAESQLRGAGIEAGTELIIIEESIDGVLTYLILVSFDSGPSDFKDKQFWVPADSIRSWNPE